MSNLLTYKTDLKSLKYSKDRPDAGYSGQPFIQKDIDKEPTNNSTEDFFPKNGDFGRFPAILACFWTKRPFFGENSPGKGKRTIFSIHVFLLQIRLAHAVRIKVNQRPHDFHNFFLCFYSVDPPSDPQPSGKLCTAHIITLHGDTIYDTAKWPSSGGVCNAHDYSRLERQTKRIFRVVPLYHPRCI